MRRLIPILLACALPMCATAAADPWMLVVDSDGVALKLAAASEIDILDCKPGRGLVRVTFNLKRQLRIKEEDVLKTPMTITAGAVTVTVPAEAYVNPNMGGTDVAADVPAKAPVLAAFARTGLLKRTALGATSGDPPASIAKAARFVRLCGG